MKDQPKPFTGVVYGESEPLQLVINALDSVHCFKPFILQYGADDFNDHVLKRLFRTRKSCFRLRNEFGGQDFLHNLDFFFLGPDGGKVFGQFGQAGAAFNRWFEFGVEALRFGIELLDFLRELSKFRLQRLQLFRLGLDIFFGLGEWIRDRRVDLVRGTLDKRLKPGSLS